MSEGKCAKLDFSARAVPTNAGLLRSTVGLSNSRSPLRSHFRKGRRPSPNAHRHSTSRSNKNLTIFQSIDLYNRVPDDQIDMPDSSNRAAKRDTIADAEVKRSVATGLLYICIQSTYLVKLMFLRTAAERISKMELAGGSGQKDAKG